MNGEDNEWGVGLCPFEFVSLLLKVCFQPGSHGWKLSSDIFFHPWLIECGWRSRRGSFLATDGRG